MGIPGVPDNFQPFKREVKPLPSGKFEVHSFVGTITGLCPCGAREPLTMPVIPGAGGVAQCGKCQTIWYVEKIEYLEPRKQDESDPTPQGKLNIGVRGMTPRIVRPT